MTRCATCEGPIKPVSPSRKKLGRGKFCSRQCLYESLKGVAPEAALAAPKRQYEKHGHNRTGHRSPTYKTWHGMKQRCLNPNNINYRRYGGRGISICEQWLDFNNFLAEMGERPEGMSLDRIEPNGNYEASNCRWATQKEQCNNWSRGHQFIVRYMGDEYTLQELADKFGIDRYTLRRRITTSRWPEDMWHLPPNKSVRPKPEQRLNRAMQKKKVIPRGAV